ncbi:MAG: apolipoprotein N-acyltransferase [Candidatus Omnitrophota bacterium]|jgi:apolipoprotein N-acyltransferase
MKKSFQLSAFSYQLLFAIVSAILLILSFPGFNFWILAWVAFIPLFLALEGQGPFKAFLISYLTGFLFFLGTIYWLIHVSMPGMLIVVAYLALYFGFFGLILSLVSAPACANGFLTFRPGLYALFLIPAAWVALEWARSYVFTGFGWALLGYSQSRNLPIIQIADVTGAYGVSFIIVMFNAALFFAIKNFRNKEKDFLIPVIMAVILIAAVSVYGLLRLNNVFTGERLKVSIVQGNIPQDQKWDARFKEKIIERYQALTILAAAERPELIIWPETSVPGFVEDEKILLEWVRNLAIAADTPLLIGAPRYEEVNGREIYYNSAFLFLKDGSIARHYDKIHLVPFGEYVPLKNLFFFVHKFAPRPIGDFMGGKEFTVLRFPIERSVKEKDRNWKLVKRVGFGCLICFEDIFPDLARGFVKNNAGFLVNITNDAWFGRSSAAYQHAQASVFRAVENRVNVIRAANTGLSCFIDQKGRIESKVSKEGKDLFVDGFKSQEIVLSRARTVYTVFGDIFAYLCILFTVFYLSALYKKKSPLSVIKSIFILSLMVLFTLCGPAYSENETGSKEILNSLNNAIESDPSNARLYFKRGNIYEEKGMGDKALSDYNSAIDLKPRYAEAFINRGIVYYKKAEFERAILDYTRALELDPSYGEAYANIGLAYTKLGKYDQALYYYNKAIDEYEDDPYLFVDRGKVYNEKGMRREAMDDFNKALELSSRNPDAYLNRGLTYAREGKFKEAIADYNRSIELDPKNAESFLSRAISYANKMELEKSMSDIATAMELNTRYPEAYLNRANLYFNQGQTDAAISDYNKALELNGQYAEAYFNRGVVYARQGDYTQAIYDYTKAIDLRPDCGEIFFNRANAYLSRGDYDNAISDFTKNIDANDKDIDSYMNRGIAYARKGNSDEAMADFKKTLEIDPKFAQAYFNMALIYDGKLQYEESLKYYTKAIEVNPKYAEAYLNRGIVYSNRTQYDQAVADFNKALSIDPKNTESYFNRGLLYDNQGKYDKALLDYNKFIELNPDHMSGYINRGILYVKRGMYDRAIDDFDKAIQANPQSANAYFNKALVCEKAGRNRDAIEAYKNFIKFTTPQLANYVEGAKDRISELEQAEHY